MRAESLIIRLIVIKKSIVATLLLILSVAAFASSNDWAWLAQTADQLGDEDRRLLAALAKRALELGPNALRGVAAITGAYAVLVYLAAWAAWTDRRWGEWLMVALLGLPLPYEVIELIHEQTINAAAVLVLNVIGLLVLLVRLRRSDRIEERGSSFRPLR